MSLNEFHDQYAEKGLVIIGLYHPKPYGTKVTNEAVRKYTAAKQFRFPIAIDEDWKNLNRYWFQNGGRDYTSISFLIDREGRIRYIHPGGSYNREGLPYGNRQWRRDYFELKEWLELLLGRL